jgi:hypothetical protein
LAYFPRLFDVVERYIDLADGYKRVQDALKMPEIFEGKGIRR